MRRRQAAIGSVIFFVIVPGMFAGLVPWLISGGEFREPAPYWTAARVVGGLLICVGLIPVVHAFAEFARAGGTPAPVAPTQRLVVSGFNRHLRNPMYAGLVVVILGQALLFGQISLVWYAGLFWFVTAAFVLWYEEPVLARQFGEAYQEYRRAVPAWWPRLRPWTRPGASEADRH